MYFLDNKTDYNLTLIDKVQVETNLTPINVVTDYYDMFFNYRVMLFISVSRIGSVVPYTGTISNIKLYQSDTSDFFNESIVSNENIVGTIPESINFSASTNDEAKTLLYNFGVEYTKKYLRLKYDYVANITNSQPPSHQIIISFSAINELLVT